MKGECGDGRRPRPLRSLRIVLDPGHGGTNHGCRYGDLVEETYVLTFAETLAAHLRGLGHLVKLTREADVTRTFTARAQVAHDFTADLAVSLHVNAMPPGKAAHGVEVFYMPDDILAQRLATSIEGAMPEHMRRRNGVRAASLDGHGDDAVLKRYECPAALVELGFATDTGDREYLLSDSGRWALVVGLAQGIKNYAAEIFL